MSLYLKGVSCRQHIIGVIDWMLKSPQISYGEILPPNVMALLEIVLLEDN